MGSKERHVRTGAARPADWLESTSRPREPRTAADRRGHTQQNADRGTEREREKMGKLSPENSERGGGGGAVLAASTRVLSPCQTTGEPEPFPFRDRRRRPGPESFPSPFLFRSLVLTPFYRDSLMTRKKKKTVVATSRPSPMCPKNRGVDRR